MSAAAGLVSRTTTPRSAGQPLRRPSLHLVPEGGRRSGRTPFAVVVVSLLAAGLLGLLMLNTVLAQDAFRLHTLKQEARALEDREELLRREVEALRAPQALAARAVELGMVQAGPPAFLRLPDGAVLGAEIPAVAPGEDPEAALAAATAAATAAAAAAETTSATDEGADDGDATDEGESDSTDSTDSTDSSDEAAE